MIKEADYLLAFTKATGPQPQTCSLCGGSLAEIKVTGIGKNILSLPVGNEAVRVEFYHRVCALKLFPKYDRRIRDIV